MITRSTLVLMIVICGLMFYSGCGEDDDGGSQGANAATPTPTASPLPEGGVPPGSPAACLSPIPPSPCDNCPCNYYAIPQTKGCWLDDPEEFFSTTWIAHCSPEAGSDCLLSWMSSNGDTDTHVKLSTSNPAGGGGRLCLVDTKNIANRPECGIQDINQFEINLTTDQISACQECLSRYALELNTVFNVPVIGVDRIACLGPPSPSPTP